MLPPAADSRISGHSQEEHNEGANARDGGRHVERMRAHDKLPRFRTLVPVRLDHHHYAADQQQTHTREKNDFPSRDLADKSGQRSIEDAPAEQANDARRPRFYEHFLRAFHHDLRVCRILVATLIDCT